MYKREGKSLCFVYIGVPVGHSS